MKKSIIVLFLTGLALAPDLVSGQSYIDNFWNRDMQVIAKPSSKWGWVDLNPDMAFDPLNMLQNHAAAFGLGSNDRMSVHRTLNDDLGFSHYRFYQYNKGVRVEGAEYITHVNPDGKVYCANGKIVSGLDKNPYPAMPEDHALQQVLSYVGADRYMWEDDFWENELKEKFGQDTSYYPQGELVWTKGEASVPWEPENFRLAWSFDIRSASPNKEQRIIIDANSGDVIKVLPLESNCSGASVSTVFNGSHTIYTDNYSGSTYRLRDNCTSAAIRVRDWNSSTATSNPIEIISGSNTWTSTNQRFGGTVLWETKRAYWYFKNVHTRNSYDNANGNVEAYVNAVFTNSSGGTYTDNASMSFSGGIMKVGLGSSGTLANSWCPLDIISHEYTHAVTASTAGLQYSNESGALNESFSDMFGEMNESYTLGTADWLEGADRANGPIRSLSNPNTYGQPDTYQGTNWYTGTSDNGGVHTNSGVQNYWFYLLCQGGSGTNDNGDAFSVSGIGNTAGRAIAYRSLVTYLISTDQYIDAREGALRSARDLYGACSNQEVQTGKAWFAVGVGTSHARYDYQICGTVATGLKQGINSVLGGGSCSNTATPSTGNVTYAAGNSITLGTGFTATASGTNYFVAYLEPCSFTVWKDDVEVADDPQAETIGDPNTILDADKLDMVVYPNPFKASTTVEIRVPRAGPVKILVYDMVGRTVMKLMDESAYPGGIIKMDIDGEGLDAGIYLLSATIDDKVLTERIVRN